MQIDDEELAVRYRHCMQTTDRQRRKSSSSVRLRPLVAASNSDWRVSTRRPQQSRSAEIFMLLIDSLPETFLDEDETSGSSTTVRTTAQVNHYDADEENIEDEGFSGASSSTSPPPSKENAILSESAQSHTYESIKSMEEAAASEPSHSASSPSPPPPPPPKNKQSKRSKELSNDKELQAGVQLDQLRSSGGVGEQVVQVQTAPEQDEHQHHDNLTRGRCIEPVASGNRPPISAAAAVSAVGFGLASTGTRPTARCVDPAVERLPMASGGSSAGRRQLGRRSRFERASSLLRLACRRAGGDCGSSSRSTAGQLLRVFSGRQLRRCC
uniref:Uncharacterized protein n=1 Tax=Macrostomum lignano TaxID=282301 RepID=A0A1I8FNZ4_9PLAT